MLQSTCFLVGWLWSVQFVAAVVVVALICSKMGSHAACPLPVPEAQADSGDVRS